MKNKNFKTRQTLKGIFVVALSLCLNSKLLSQNHPINFGISANSSVSGAGFGVMYSPGVFCQVKDCKMELSMNIQKSKLNISGAQANFEYILFSDSKGYYKNSSPGDLELFTFFTFKYNYNAFLSSSQIKREKFVAPDANIAFQNLKFTSIGVYAGLGLKIALTEKLKFNNSIGFGGWKTLKGERNLYREYNGLSLLLTTGLSYNF